MQVSSWSVWQGPAWESLWAPYVVPPSNLPKDHHLLHSHLSESKWGHSLDDIIKGKWMSRDQNEKSHCLLDTPCTVRKSEKPTFWQVIVQTSRPKFWKQDFSRICENDLKACNLEHLLRSNMQNYSHLKVLYIKSLYWKNSLSSHSCHLVKNYFFWTKLLRAYVQCVYIVKANYQIAPSKAVVGVDRPMKALSMHIQKPY